MELCVVVLGRKIRLNLTPFNIFKANQIILKVLDATTYRKVTILKLDHESIMREILNIFNCS